MTTEAVKPSSTPIDGFFDALADEIAKLRPDEQATLDAFRARRRARPPAPRIDVQKDADATVLRIGGDESGVQAMVLAEALGLSAIRVLTGFIHEIASIVMANGALERERLDFVVETIAALAPRNELEAMLAAQMVATHLAAMKQLERLAKSDSIPRLEANERAANRLMRTFTAQTDALRKLRTGGEQKVEVRHVHVNDGGNAIIGAVQAGGGAHEKT